MTNRPSHLLHSLDDGDCLPRAWRAEDHVGGGAGLTREDVAHLGMREEKSYLFSTLQELIERG